MNTLNEFLRLSGNEDRFRMIVLLYQEKLCVCHLSGILKLSQPTVSKNLAKLRDTRFVQTYKEGKYIYYSFVCEDKNINIFLESVVNNIDDYPKLKEDSLKLSYKEQFKNNCKCNF